jgi:DNA invertase Pin-like site-specific DNA recombinase
MVVILADVAHETLPFTSRREQLWFALGGNMRSAIYARVSTKDQSCEMQVRDLRAYCAARGCTIIREYVDLCQSGGKDSRPQLNELMADARKRKLDAVIVWRFDQFARSTKHLLLALEEFRSLGVQFISYQENIDTSSPLGQALFTIVSAVAQLERDLIRERVSAGVRNARASGKQFGRHRRIVNQDELIRLKAEGASLRQIAEKLGIGYGTVRTRLR